MELKNINIKTWQGLVGENVNFIMINNQFITEDNMENTQINHIIIRR